MSPAPGQPPNLDSPLDPATRALIRLAAAIAAGDDALVADRSRAAVAADVPPVWVDELLLQSVLMVGWPRALVAAGIWRQESGARGPATDVSLAEDPGQWRARGETACALIYGDNYQRLRENVRALHPALDAWMISDGYGRILSRPALDLKRRELCTVAQTAVLGTARQLHSHLRGSLHAGAAPGEVEEAMALTAEDLTPELAAGMRATWEKVVRREAAS